MKIECYRHTNLPMIDKKMNYQKAWAFLDNLQFFKIKLGLDSMTMFLDELGNPQKDLKFIHIAGTNGKGSVGVTLLTILARAGYQVGFYTSPHLSSVRERFRINDTYISEDEFAEEATRIGNILDGRQITYFEFTTALALLWFARKNVDIVILETGLGGRLDATNVVTPLVSIITNVSMDHEAYLGDTLSEVAAEKAGIIKPGVPVVSGVGLDPTDKKGEVLKVISNTCHEKGTPLYLLNDDFYAEEEKNTWAYWSLKRKGGCMMREKISGLETGLIGDYQRGNAALALATLDLLTAEKFCVSEDDIREGLKEVRWPGRLEYACISQEKLSLIDCSDGNARRFLLDGAHNPAGVQSLKKALLEEIDYDKLILVWGAMADKDIPNTLPDIAELANNIILTRPEGERSAEPEQMLSILPGNYADHTICISLIPDALKKSAEMAGPSDLICVAGSLYLVGETRRILLGELVTN